MRKDLLQRLWVGHVATGSLGPSSLQLRLRPELRANTGQWRWGPFWNPCWFCRLRLGGGQLMGREQLRGVIPDHGLQGERRTHL